METMPQRHRFKARRRLLRLAFAGLVGLATAAVSTFLVLEPAAARAADWAVQAITRSAMVEYDPVIRDRWIAWKANDGNDCEIFLYDRQSFKAFQLTDNDVDEGNVRVDGDRVVWDQEKGPGQNGYEVWLYSPDRGTQRLAGTEPGGAVRPDIDGHRVVWFNDQQLCLHDLTTGTTQILTSTWGQNLRLEGNIVAWQKYVDVGGKMDWEIHFLQLPAAGETAMVVRVAHPGFWDEAPSIGGDRIVWTAGPDPGPGPNDLFLYDISSGILTNVTNDATYDSGAVLENGIIYWSRQDKLCMWDLANPGPQVIASGSGVFNPDVHDDSVVFSSFSTRWDVLLATPGTAPSNPFTDVGTTTPYRQAILDLHKAGIVSGSEVPGGGMQFKPYNYLLRQQFAKIMVGAMCFDVWEDMTTTFVDLPADNRLDLYPNEFVAAAQANGVVQGKTQTIFDPYSDVTRAQVITMVVRAGRAVKAEALPDPPPGFSAVLGQFDNVHAPNLRIAEYHGVLGGLLGYGQAWDPWAKASRGEACQLIANLMHELELD